MQLVNHVLGLGRLQRALENAAKIDADVVSTPPPEGAKCGTAPDPVNHPSHYTAGSIEVIDFIEDQGFDYLVGNAVKYLSRAGRKDPTKHAEDLRKAIWYINRKIQALEKEDLS
ncbi:DUF3310 domain-containing protein [Chitinophaga sp. NPDC101104]|uniref:DUF3310 domain-containing protein n=1 Tax=Chitinophaga sp. NPDC101104 TaxID=3390561 RepID=UPI003D032576